MRSFAEKKKQPQLATLFNRTRSSLAPPVTNPEVAMIPQSQRSVGGQAEQQLMGDSVENPEAGFEDTVQGQFTDDFSRIPVPTKSRLPIQAKLTVNPSGDAYEQEADRVAEKVMQMPQRTLQHACACGGTCPKCQMGQSGHGAEGLQIQRVGADDLLQSEVPPIVYDVLQSPGRPIDPVTRASMETRFGHDFSRVRLHADDRAAHSARAIHALAYTAGNHIAFAANQYQPHTSTGLRLFAHELTHVVQQTNTVAPAVQRQPGPTFPKKGLQVTGPDAKELLQILSDCIGTQLSLDKNDMLTSGKKNKSKNTSKEAQQQILSLIKDPNGIIIDTDRNVTGAVVGAFRPTQPGFHNVNIQHIKAMQAASGSGGGFDACAAIVHELSEAAKGRELGVKGNTAEADLLPLSHQVGFDIENKVRADFKLPARAKSNDKLRPLYNFQDKGFQLSLIPNTYGDGKDLRTQLSVIKTSYVISNNKRQILGNEVLASHVEMGAVALGTVDESRDAFKKFFPKIYSQVGSP
jgi:hypothetical protein